MSSKFTLVSKSGTPDIAEGVFKENAKLKFTFRGKNLDMKRIKNAIEQALKG